MLPWRLRRHWLSHLSCQSCAERVLVSTQRRCCDCTPAQCQQGRINGCTHVALDAHMQVVACMETAQVLDASASLQAYVCDTQHSCAHMLNLFAPCRRRLGLPLWMRHHQTLEWTLAPSEAGHASVVLLSWHSCHICLLPDFLWPPSSLLPWRAEPLRKA